MRAAARLVLVATLLPALAAAADPYQCWQARETPGTGRFVPRTLAVADAFGAFSTRIARPRSVCNPTSIDGAALEDATAHLACWDARDDVYLTGRFRTEYAQIANGLGTQTIAIQKPQQLCAPSETGIAPASPVPSALQLDPYRCYKAKGVPGFPTPVASLGLVDQFAARTVTTRTMFRFCTPASVDGAALRDPGAHLACYRFSDDTGSPLADNVPLNTESGFGALALTARTSATRVLCLPTTATFLNP